MNPKLNLDIWSDMLCPFCFIAKHNLDQALASFPDAKDIEIRWHSYQLAPHISHDPTKDAHQALADHKGMTRETALQLNQQVAQMAAQAGLSFDVDNMKWANTLKAHRLLQWVKTQGKAHELEERLFQAVFSKGENIEDESVLLNIVDELGLSTQEAASVLGSNAFTEAVEQDIRNAQYVGLRGVPHFVINEKSAFSGALPPESFLKILTQIHQEWKSSQITPLNVQGQNCDLSGNCD